MSSQKTILITPKVLKGENFKILFTTDEPKSSIPAFFDNPLGRSMYVPKPTRSEITKNLDFDMPDWNNIDL